MPWGSARVAFLLALGAAAGCSAPPPLGPPPAPAVAGARYEARVVSTSPWVLEVELTVAGSADRLVANEAPHAVQAVEVRAGARREAPARTGAGWPIRCPRGCTLRYRIDLSEAARASGDDPSVALRSGGDVVAPASTWLLRPEPLTPHVPLEVSVVDASGVRFASGFASRRDCLAGGAGAAPCPARTTFQLLSQELRTAGYTAFGDFAALRAEASGGVVDIAVLGGERAAGDDVLVRWVGRMARAMDHLYGRFPVPRVQLIVVPEPLASEPTWGRTLPSGGLSILLTLGARAREEDLARDWILVHEMIHLGVPSFWREGRWLDEGLATYYEPVIRARAGLISELDVWTEFAVQMPRGVGEPGDLGLAQATRRSRVYWGGAAFALRADALVRQRTAGARSLDDGLRAALDRGGDATRIWSLEGYLRAIDEATRVPVMRELYASVAGAHILPCAGAPRKPRAPALLATPDPRAPALLATPDPGGPTLALVPRCSSPEAEALSGLLLDLGVARGPDGVIVLRDAAPLSAVRRAIARGRSARE